MKKNLLLSLLVLLNVYYLNAQSPDTTYWKKAFRAGINFNQASFSDNWTGGGVNSIGVNTFLNYKANYTRDVHSWDNEIDLAYGVLKNDGQSSRKSLDRVFLDTKYGRKLNAKWSLFTSLSLLTQFADGFAYDQERPNGETYDSLISGLFSPAFITTSLGFEYKPVDYFSLRLSPFSPRITVVSNDNLANTPSPEDPLKGAFGVDLGDNIRTEWLAFQLVADFNKDIAKNLNLKWKYILFANYEELEFDKIDHRLDLLLSAKVNDFMDVSLGLIMVYDFDQVDEVQLSQALNLGVVYNFKNYKE
ncbi:DUF3078 domain-containing protein [Fulvivirga sp. M361]|uniref:DUF3078 domain-containing protein n=1 Tax=Fulvivirga sp. M361 TaxID=2594266 RepID=UPI00117AEDC3|nr:DUF3078 domain-containing protein [Fulvivirga sp. M361]TRX59376.1 DUF3078 domain-containing protein [Fulvivirga sp. M361]